MGTRFVATRESMAFATFKKALLEESGDATTVTDVFTGRYARVLRNTFAESYARSGAPVLPFPWHYMAPPIFTGKQPRKTATIISRWWPGRVWDSSTTSRRRRK